MTDYNELKRMVNITTKQMKYDRKTTRGFSHYQWTEIIPTKSKCGNSTCYLESYKSGKICKPAFLAGNVFIGSTVVSVFAIPLAYVVTTIVLTLLAVAERFVILHFKRVKELAISKLLILAFATLGFTGRVFCFHQFSVAALMRSRALIGTICGEKTYQFPTLVVF